MNDRGLDHLIFEAMPSRSTAKSKLTDASASRGNSKKAPQKANAKAKEIASSTAKKNTAPKRAKSDLGASKENKKESAKAAVNDKKKSRITEIKPKNEGTDFIKLFSATYSVILHVLYHSSKTERFMEIPCCLPVPLGVSLFPQFPYLHFRRLGDRHSGA